MAWGFVPAELRHAGFWDAGVCVPVALPPPLCLPQCNIIIFIFQNGTILIRLLSNVDCRLQTFDSRGYSRDRWVDGGTSQNS